ncbi:carbamoyl-phosphate synthase large chain [Clostridium putrefaciens]|uniref:Carbamoyl-phosphate synthase large chain n=1 Tax=Clostridium putrefaciens TaxID=99675 RepID=A0A381J6W9_9CLOT|nr:ATP-grasp domain-containing protein [Clostridium putrefaciens]SUY45806.1 carbamoyl-phosphate synthase large chain [Clostridium putrefaciens]
MTQRKLMILGASELQLPAILKAKEKGIYVVGIDMNKGAVGVKYVDEFYELSTIDTEGILDKAVELNIDGIMTLATDMPMRSVAAVGERLNLNTITQKTAVMATDKARMREQLSKFNVPIPFFSSVLTYKEFEKAVNSFNGDIIIKPSDSSGSRGVYFLKDRNELEKAYEYSRRFSKSGEVVVEEYMYGPEVSVETITIKGITHIIAITDKETTGPPYFVEMGHSIQSSLCENIKKDIKKVTKAAIAAIGIDNSSAHTEIIVTSQGAKVVELGARLGGDNITTSLVPLATGIDMVEACIDLALGDEPKLEKVFNKGAAIRYFNSNSGTLSGFQDIEKARNKEGIQSIIISKFIGDKIGEIRSSVDRIGYIISQAESNEKAIDICKKTVNEIKIIID